MGGTDSVVAQWFSRLRPLIEPVLVVLTVGALAAGGIAWLVGRRDIADGCWIAGTVLAVLPALVWVVVALRHGGSAWMSLRCCRWLARCSFTSIWLGH